MTDLYTEGAKVALEQAKDGKMQAIFPLPFFEETRIAGHGTGGGGWEAAWRRKSISYAPEISALGTYKKG